MSKLKRYYYEGQIYFVTSVTYQRQPLLAINYDILWKAIDRTGKRLEFNLIAHVFLPDHIHLLIDPGKNNPSDIMHRIKLSFGVRYRKRHNLFSGRVWQKRFWDHVIRDQNDMKTHIDYIHYNPVKHGFVQSPFKYKQSSIHRYYDEGYYAQDWGCREPLIFGGEYGDEI